MEKMITPADDIITEKRAAVRYPVELFVEFDNGDGWTRDVSTVGACIETDRPLDCGSAVRFVLHHPDRQDGMTRIECGGIVVRAEPIEKKWKIGVSMKEVCFGQ